MYILPSLQIQFVVYSATFFSNMGNYKSFGDTKFIPSISADVFHTIVKATAAYAADSAAIDTMWESCSRRLYALEARDKTLGLGEDSGISTYYSQDFTKEKADMIQRYLDGNGISAYNTRVFTTADGVFQIQFASAESKVEASEIVEFEGNRIQLVYGDFGPLMARVSANLTKALEHVANPIQKDMITVRLFYSVVYLRIGKVCSVDFMVRSQSSQ